MKHDNKQFLYFSGLAFLSALLAVTLFIICGYAWQQPMGSRNIADVFLMFFILHLPVWFIVLLISGIAVKKAIPDKAIYIAALLLLCFLITPLILSKVIVLYDNMVIAFYAADFFFCLAILLKMKNRMITAA